MNKSAVIHAKVRQALKPAGLIADIAQLRSMSSRLGKREHHAEYDHDDAEQNPAQKQGAVISLDWATAAFHQG
jgi:hypothetical protein